MGREFAGPYEGGCDPEAGTFSMSFSFRGLASGPYPGTFIESGTATGTVTGLHPSLSGVWLVTLTSFNTRFEIDSLVGQVEGTKEMVAPLPGWTVACRTDDPSPNLAGIQSLEQAMAVMRYEATITAETGVYRDSGLADTVVLHAQPVEPPGPEFGVLSEQFTLSDGVLPLDTSGKATGGGQIMAGLDLLEAVTLGFNVRKSEDEERLNGNCNVLDHATGTHVKCLTVTDYQQIGNAATWEGIAEVNGVEEDYRITVQDNGEPNSGLDTFSIVTDTYDAAGNVQHGNIQVHLKDVATLP